MTWRSQLAAIAFITSCFASFSVARPQQKKIGRAELPRLVQSAVDQESKGAMIRGFSMETDQGSRVYEVELESEGRGKNISMDATGKVLQVEEEISMDSLPIAAQQGLAVATGEGVIDKIESLTRRGALVAYEAVVKTGTKWSTILVGPEGKRLDAVD